ncbi:MAG TPA: nucleoside hydrolase, partial [Actinomycetales bacterium]|nr:nucleoside hydrolase [Actinomycetales bacterium]
STCALVLGGCAAPYDGDGESRASMRLAPAAQQLPSATPVVVDTDLGADDLVAMALLLRHPSVHVEAITVAATGLVGCPEAADVVADLAAALAVASPVVACGRAAPGPSGRVMPAEWRRAAAESSGLPEASAEMRHFLPVTLSATPAAELLAQTARRSNGLNVVALGPLTNLADLATSDRTAYAQVRAVHVMGGVVAAPGDDGVGEWNAAADPDAFGTVLSAARAGGPRVTIVPLDAVPGGTPQALTGPVVGAITARAGLPAWWDVATAAAVVAPAAAVTTTGTYRLGAAQPGRLTRTGDGPVRVVQHLDPITLDQVYDAVFAAA